MAVVGDLTIKTKIDNNDLDKQIKVINDDVLNIAKYGTCIRDLGYTD